MKVRTHITIEKELLDYAKRYAKQYGVSLSAFVGILINIRRGKDKDLCSLFGFPVG